MQYSTERARYNWFFLSIADNKKAEEDVSTVNVHDLKGETGLDVLTEKLDNAFEDEIIEDTYSIYLKIT